MAACAVGFSNWRGKNGWESNGMGQRDSKGAEVGVVERGGRMGDEGLAGVEVRGRRVKERRAGGVRADGDLSVDVHWIVGSRTAPARLNWRTGSDRSILARLHGSD